VILALAALVAGSALAAGGTAPDAPADPTTTTASQDFVNCLTTHKKGALLFLIDESGSLKYANERTGRPAGDPDGQRVPGVNSLLTTFADPRYSQNYRLRAQVAGFASSFARGAWSDLTKDKAPDLKAKVQEFATKTSGQETDYYNALAGALGEFHNDPEFADQSDVCQAIFWASDGELDIVSDSQAQLDTSPAGPGGAPKNYLPAGMTTAACQDGPESTWPQPCPVEDYVKGLLCASGSPGTSSLAERIRAAGVWLFGLGLGDEATTDWSLMKAIVEGSDYPPTGGACGPPTAALPHPGTFWPIRSGQGPKSIASALKDAFGSGSHTTAPVCPDADVDQCRFSFQLQDWIEQATIFATVDTSRIPDFAVYIKPPEGDRILLDAGGATPNPYRVGDTTVSWVWESPGGDVAPGTVTISLQGKGAHWSDAPWSVKLVGNPASGNAPNPCQPDDPDCAYISFGIDGGLRPQATVTDQASGQKLTTNDSVHPGQEVTLAAGVIRAGSGASVPASAITGDVTITSALDFGGTPCDHWPNLTCGDYQWDKSHLGAAKPLTIPRDVTVGAGWGISLTLKYAIPPLLDSQSQAMPGTETVFQPQTDGVTLPIAAALGNATVDPQVDFGELNDRNGFQATANLAVHGPAAGLGTGCVWLTAAQNPPAPVGLGALTLWSGPDPAQNMNPVCVAEGQSGVLPLTLRASQPATADGFTGTILVAAAPASALDDKAAWAQYKVKFYVSARHTSQPTVWTTFAAAVLLGLGLPLLLFWLAKRRLARIKVDGYIRVWQWAVDSRSGQVCREDGSPLAWRNDKTESVLLGPPGGDQAVDAEPGKYQEIDPKGLTSLVLPGTAVRLDAVSGGLLGTPLVKASVPGQAVAAGVPPTRQTVGSDHHGELPLAILDTWLVVVDPTAPAGRAQVVLISATADTARQLLTDIVQTGADLINRVYRTLTGRSVAAAAADSRWPAGQGSGGPSPFGGSPFGGSPFGGSPFGGGHPGSGPAGSGSSSSPFGSSPLGGTPHTDNPPGTGPSRVAPGASPFGGGSSGSSPGASPFGSRSSGSAPSSGPAGSPFGGDGRTGSGGTGPATGSSGGSAPGASPFGGGPADGSATPPPGPTTPPAGGPSPFGPRTPPAGGPSPFGPRTPPAGGPSPFAPRRPGPQP